LGGKKPDHAVSLGIYQVQTFLYMKSSRLEFCLLRGPSKLSVIHQSKCSSSSNSYT